MTQLATDDVIEKLEKKDLPAIISAEYEAPHRSDRNDIYEFFRPGDSNKRLTPSAANLYHSCWLWFIKRHEEDIHKQKVKVLCVIEEDEDGGFVAYSPSLPGAVSQGDTLQEAEENLREAIIGCIESYLEMGEPIPWNKTPDVVEGNNIIKQGWIEVDV